MLKYGLRPKDTPVVELTLLESAGELETVTNKYGQGQAYLPVAAN